MVVCGIQAACFLLASLLAVVPSWAALDVEAFRPTFYRFPLDGAGADASSPEVVRDELAAALPGVEVEIEEDSILLVGRRADVMTPVPFRVLAEHGHPPSGFSVGRVFDPDGGVRQVLASSASVLGLILLTQPLVYAAAGVLLRRRSIPPWPRRRGGPTAAIVGIGAGLGLAIGVDAVVRWLGLGVVEQPVVRALAGAGAIPLAMLAVVAIVVAPVGEELFFRGWMFRYLDARIGRAVGCAASALLFAAVHLHPPAFAIYFALALAFVGLYVWSGSLWTPILAHATINAIAVAALVT